jgi:NADH:ubiquinone oxidoreductase subunit 6 (subunit J)
LIYGTEWFVSDAAAKLEPTTAAIGNALLTEYLFPFEIISVLLLGTLVGAVALGRKEVEEKKNHG